MVQIVVVGFILFLNPGYVKSFAFPVSYLSCLSDETDRVSVNRMYNALAGLGGAGQVDATAQNNAGIALHTTFAVVGFVVGIAHNFL